MIRAGDRKFYAMVQRHALDTHSPDYARSYRASDERGKTEDSHISKCVLIRELSRRFDHAIDVLDLGCGTGRYFHCIENARSVVGVDLSRNMLEYAKNPVCGGSQRISLLQSSVHEVHFQPAVFDLVICVGVFGAVCPLDVFILQRISTFIRPGGMLLLTIPEYIPVASTWKRTVVKLIEPLLFGKAKRYVNLRLHEFHMSEANLLRFARPYFSHVTVTRWTSPTRRVDLHCVASR